MCRTLAVVLAVLSVLSPAFAERGTVTPRRVNVHTYPSAGAPVMASVSAGTQFEVESRDGEWLRVRPVGEPPGSPRTGYVHSSALRLEQGAAVPPAAAGAIAIDHRAAACLGADVYPRLEACLEPAAEVSRARVQFRAAGTSAWYYVDMARDGQCHRGTLPRPLPSTTAVEYYVEAVNRSFLETRTGVHRPRVVPARADCRNLATPSDLGSATVTVGTTVVGAPAQPPGFNASGLVAAAAVAAVSPPAPAPPRPVAAAPAGTAPPAEADEEGGGGFPTRLALLGVLAAGGGTAVYLATRPPDPETIDDDGDGFSEKQGDCNDRDQDIKPGGGFDFRIEFAYGPNSIVACSARNAAQQNYRVTNNGCDTLVVENLSFSQTVSAPCTGSGGTTLALSATRVAPGETVTVRQGAAPGTVAPICCPSYPCSQAPCVFNIQYTINTSAGSQMLSNSYVVADGTGRDCPLCGSIGTDEVLRGAPRATIPPGGY
jgi:hypothetical protein